MIIPAGYEHKGGRLPSFAGESHRLHASTGSASRLDAAGTAVHDRVDTLGRTCYSVLLLLEKHAREY